ncbi:MAG TPA: VOC family protein, partial [Phytomonospora sp.]
DDCGDGGAVGPPSGVRIVFEAVGAASVIGGLMADGLLGRLVFAVGDCDVVFARAEASGAEVMQEPITRPGGVRDCVVRDPSGNMLRFVQSEGVGGCSR